MRKAYASLATDGQAVVLDQVAQALNTASHPNVSAGRISERDAYMEFLAQFNTQDRDGIISQDEFLSVHRAFSGSVTNSADFEAAINAFWKL